MIWRKTKFSSLHGRSKWTTGIMCPRSVLFGLCSILLLGVGSQKLVKLSVGITSLKRHNIRHWQTCEGGLAFMITKESPSELMYGGHYPQPPGPSQPWLSQIFSCTELPVWEEIQFISPRVTSGRFTFSYPGSHHPRWDSLHSNWGYPIWDEERPVQGEVKFPCR